MDIIIIQGPSNTGKTGVCTELIGIRHKPFFIKNKHKNQIAAVYLKDKNTNYPNFVISKTIPPQGKFCLVVSEGDSTRCIDNIFLPYTDPKGNRHNSYIEQCNIRTSNTPIDYLIVTIRDTVQNKILNTLTKHSKTFGHNIVGTVHTQYLTNQSASLCTYYIDKAIDVLNYVK